MMMKRGKVDKKGESMVAIYRYLEVSNPGLQMIGSNECDVSCLYMAPEPHSSISEEFLHSTILRPIKPLGSWNLVNPMNEASMDECAAILQPLLDQYKPKQYQTFAMEKNSKI